MSLAHTAIPSASPQRAACEYAPLLASSRLAPSPLAPSPLTPSPLAPSPESAGATRGVLDVDLALRHAGLRRLQVAYEWQGAIDAPVVLVAGGISANRHVASSETFPDTGWWEAQVGGGRALDPAQHRILAIDWLGSDGTLDAPIDPADQADAIAAVLDALGIRRLIAFVGCSYGAMVGLQFASAYSDRVQQLIAISGTDRAHPYASAWRALQRRAVALGALQCDEAGGLALARELAMLSYRTPAEFAERFPAPAKIVHGRVRCEAEDYLDACGQRYVERTAPTAFLRLSESIDLHWVDPATIRVPTTLVAVVEDRVVPVEDAFTLAERLPGARLKLLHSRFGHDAFLKEVDVIAATLRESLAGCRGGAA